MRDIVRREQDLALEISEKTLQGVGAGVASNGGAIITGASDVNAMFERAAAGLRELGEVWMNAQMRSLDAMRCQASSTNKPTTTRRHEASTAA